MASKPSSGGGGGSRWPENKIYPRKSLNNKNTNKFPNKRIRQTLDPGGYVSNSSQPPELTRFDVAAASDDDSSTFNGRQLSSQVPVNREFPSPPPSINGFALKLENRVTINLSSKLKQDLREIRRKLTKELDQVRNLIKKLETNNYSIENGSSSNRDKSKAAPLRRLSLSGIEDSQGELTDNTQKEKKKPKTNQPFRNSEKTPLQESNKKSKFSGVKKGGNGEMGEGKLGFELDKNSSKVFKSCSDLLGKLMKHKHGWVFNTPVDVKGLGLRDYYVIIKNPMDLGTVKNKLNKNGYKSPNEFADDVRLTFNNAMAYNRKGQDVHIMAEELLKIFEDKWVVIQSQFNTDSRFVGDNEVSRPNPVRKKTQLSPPEMRTLEKSESTTVPVNSQLKSSDGVTSGRVSTQKRPKPKVSEINKREMTYEEKQKLSMNLQSLPLDKLDNVVQIIKNRNSSLLHSDDEIEVDIDSVDTETLWELDRFVIYYKKSLGKNKRKAENDIQRGEETEQKVEEMDPAPTVVEMEVPKEAKSDEKNVSSSSPVLREKVNDVLSIQKEKRGDIASRSSSSGSSSSDSGSSSSDSDSDSSSASDTGH